MKSDELEQVYRKYYREVYLYALALCRNPADAEELASETFFKALVSAGDGKPHIKYWLLRVCRNLWLDMARKNRFRDERPIEELTLAVYDGTLSRLIRDEEARLLWLKLMKLPESARELLTMYYFMGCDIRKIAAATGKAPGAVKTALSRARASLKTLMETEENR